MVGGPGGRGAAELDPEWMAPSGGRDEQAATDDDGRDVAALLDPGLDGGHIGVRRGGERVPDDFVVDGPDPGMEQARRVEPGVRVVDAFDRIAVDAVDLDECSRDGVE